NQKHPPSHLPLCRPDEAGVCPERRGPGVVELLKEEIGRTGIDASRKRDLSHESQLPSHLSPGPYCGGLSRRHVVSLRNSGSARADHSGASHRRAPRPGVRVRGKTLGLSRLDYRSCGSMLVQDLGRDLLAEINLGFAIVAQVSLKFDDIKVEMIERCPHRIKLILCLDDKFVISVRVCPFFLLLGQRPIATLPAPFLARPANPTVEDLSVRKVDDFSKLGHQIGELDVRLLTSQLMADLVG